MSITNLEKALLLKMWVEEFSLKNNKNTKKLNTSEINNNNSKSNSNGAGGNNNINENGNVGNNSIDNNKATSNNDNNVLSSIPAVSDVFAINNTTKKSNFATFIEDYYKNKNKNKNKNKKEKENKKENKEYDCYLPLFGKIENINEAFKKISEIEKYYQEMSSKSSVYIITETKRLNEEIINDYANDDLINVLVNILRISAEINKSDKWKQLSTNLRSIVNCLPFSEVKNIINKSNFNSLMQKKLIGKINSEEKTIDFKITTKKLASSLVKYVEDCVNTWINKNVQIDGSNCIECVIDIKNFIKIFTYFDKNINKTNRAMLFSTFSDYCIKKIFDINKKSNNKGVDDFLLIIKIIEYLFYNDKSKVITKEFIARLLNIKFDYLLKDNFAKLKDIFDYLSPCIRKIFIEAVKSLRQNEFIIKSYAEELKYLDEFIDKENLISYNKFIIDDESISNFNNREASDVFNFIYPMFKFSNFKSIVDFRRFLNTIEEDKEINDKKSEGRNGLKEKINVNILKKHIENILNEIIITYKKDAKKYNINTDGIHNIKSLKEKFTNLSKDMNNSFLGSVSKIMIKLLDLYLLLDNNVNNNNSLDPGVLEKIKDLKEEYNKLDESRNSLFNVDIKRMLSEIIIVYKEEKKSTVFKFKNKDDENTNKNIEIKDVNNDNICKILGEKEIKEVKLLEIEKFNFIDVLKQNCKVNDKEAMYFLNSWTQEGFTAISASIQPIIEQQQQQSIPISRSNEKYFLHIENKHLVKIKYVCDVDFVKRKDNKTPDFKYENIGKIYINQILNESIDYNEINDKKDIITSGISCVGDNQDCWAGNQHNGNGKNLYNTTIQYESTSKEGWVAFPKKLKFDNIKNNLKIPTDTLKIFDVLNKNDVKNKTNNANSNSGNNNIININNHNNCDKNSSNKNANGNDTINNANGNGNKNFSNFNNKNINLFTNNDVTNEIEEITVKFNE